MEGKGVSSPRMTWVPLVYPEAKVYLSYDFMWYI